MTRTTTPHPDTGELLTFGQVAARLGIGVQDVRRWVRTEQCPTVRVGAATRIPAAWVADLLAKGV